MIEKIVRLAEAAASSVGESRRGFLGRVGRAALGTVGLLGVLVTLPGDAHANRPSAVCCWYGSIYNLPVCLPKGSKCPATSNGYPLVKEERNCCAFPCCSF
jgi:hypothetical protein